MNAAERCEALIASMHADLDEYVAPVAGQQIADQLRKQDPEALDAWLRANAGRIIAERLTFLDRSDRAKARSRGPARRFREAVDRLPADPGATGPFRTFCVIDAANTRRRVGDMTGEDHRYVAGNYEASGKRDLMLAAFHFEIAKRVGDRRTAEVFLEAEYQSLEVSITGARSIKAA